MPTLHEIIKILILSIHANILKPFPPKLFLPALRNNITLAFWTQHPDMNLSTPVITQRQDFFGGNSVVDLELE